MASSARMTLIRPAKLWAYLCLLMAILFVTSTYVLRVAAVRHNQRLADSQLGILVKLRAPDLMRGDARSFVEGVGGEFPDVFVSVEGAMAKAALGEKTLSENCAKTHLPIGLDPHGLDLTLCRPLTFPMTSLFILSLVFASISVFTFFVVHFAEKQGVRNLAAFFRRQGVAIDEALPLGEMLDAIGTLADEVDKARHLEVAMARTEAFNELARKVAHDIRAPLAALRYMSESLDSSGSETGRRLQEVTTRIRGIADDLLNPGTTEKRVEDRPLSLMLEAVRDEFAAIVAGREGVKFEALGLEELPFSQLANLHELHRALSNLLTNALEALDGPGNILLKVSVLPDSFRIVVSDSGTGIPPEILSRLGERGATFNKSCGNGLGLYGARTFVERIGGAFHIESELGNGTSVSLVLPRKSQTIPRPEEYEEPQETQLHGDEEPQPTRVLLDDDVFIREIWEESAKRFGRLLLSFASPEEFERVRDDLTKDAVIFLDSEIGGETRGEQFALQLYEQGFRNLYLATGHDADDFEEMPWLKGILGKDPPEALFSRRQSD